MSWYVLTLHLLRNRPPYFPIEAGGLFGVGYEAMILLLDAMEVLLVAVMNALGEVLLEIWAQEKACKRPFDGRCWLVILACMKNLRGEQNSVSCQAIEVSR